MIHRFKGLCRLKDISLVNFVILQMSTWGAPHIKGALIIVTRLETSIIVVASLKVRCRVWDELL